MADHVASTLSVSGIAQRRRTLLGIGLSLGVFVWSLGSVFSPWILELRIPLPLAGTEGFPVPVAFWLGIGLYAWASGLLFDLTVKERWVRALRLGVSFHLLLLLGTLLPSMAAPTPQVFASRWYALYLQAVWGVVLGGGVVVAWEMWQGWRATRHAGPYFFFLPLWLGYGAFWMMSLRMNPGWVVLSTAIGIGWLILRRQGLLRRETPEWCQKLRRSLSEERVFLWLVLTVALGIRVFYTTRVMTNPDFLNTGSDGPLYDALAWDLAQGRALPETIRHTYAFLVPGYIRFVALLYWLGGRNYFLVCAVQSVLGALACVLTYATAKTLFGRTTATIAAGCAAVAFPLVFSAAALGHQAVDLFLSSVVVWCLIRYLEQPAAWGVGKLFGIGLVLGWAAVTREPNVVFWLLLVGWLLLVVSRSLGMRTAVRHAVWLTLGVLVVLVPVVYADLVKSGTTASFHARLVRLWFINAPYQHEMPVNPIADPGGAMALLLTHPLALLVPMAKNIVSNFSTVFLSQGYGRFDPIFLIRGSGYYYGMWFYAYVCALVGLGLMIRRCISRAPHALGMGLLLVFLLSRTGVHLFLEAAYRHRAPLEPFLIMLAAYGLTQALRIDKPDVLAVG